MTRSFVALNDPVHRLLRRITRRTPLFFPNNGHDPSDPARAPAPPLATCPFGLSSCPPSYRISDIELPEAYFSLALLHAVGGMRLADLAEVACCLNPADRVGVAEQVNYFDIIKLDKRCARDLRLKPKKFGPGMLAAELLSFGTGVLRARNDDALDALHQYLWSEHGRIQPSDEKVYARIWALHPRPGGPLPPGKESYDSTNVIYGDTLGELEQLWDRRAESDFLDRVAASLQGLRKHGEIAAYLQPPLKLRTVFQIHLQRQSMWRTPPSNGRVLLRRLERILDNTVVDSDPETAFCAPGSPAPPSAPQAPLGAETSGWQTDSSGYDGWLRENDQPPNDPDLTDSA